MVRIFFTILIVMLSHGFTVAQDESIYLPYKGGVYSAIIEDGDTLYLAELDHITITSPRKFESREDYLLYMRYKRYAAHVYPYAMTAIRLFREIEDDLSEMNNRQRRRFVRKLQRRMKDEFEEPLRNMTKTQGYILVKMIERELDTPMFYLIRDLKSGFAATYWGTLSSFFGYDLKEGYEHGKDDLLDLVLDDLKIEFPGRNFAKDTKDQSD